MSGLRRFVSMGRSRGRAPKGAPPDGCVRSLVVPCKGGYGRLNPILFSPQKNARAPHISSSPTRSRRGGLADRSRRKGSSGASLGHVPLASGQARQQQTSSAACEEPEAGVSCRMSHSSARCQCKNAFAPRQLGARPACFPACARASQSSGGLGILALPFIHSR